MKKGIKIVTMLITLTLLSVFHLPIQRVQAIVLPVETPCVTIESEDLQVSETDSNPSGIVLPNLLFVFFTQVE